MAMTEPCLSSDPVRLSIIVPLFNEEESVKPLHSAIVSSLSPLGLSFEIVFVNDGSEDRTQEVAVAVATADSRVRVVRFRRNYGQTQAMAAGIAHARGDVLVTMDGDLQNDPADIELLVAKIDAGFDIVVGWRQNRQDLLLSRKVPSKIANWLIGWVTGVPIRDNGCSLKAFRAAIIQRIPLYSEMHRFIPAVASIAGPRIAEIPVRHHARKYGRSKYGLSRVYKVLLDLLVIKTITSFASRPLRWFALLSLPALALSLIFFAMIFRRLLVGSDTVPLPLLGSALMFLASAVISVSSGAVAELIYSLGDVRDDRFAQLTLRTTAEVPHAG